MTTGVRIWSKTAASNNSADSNVNWAEGMAPSAVNNSARAEMASVAKWRDDNSGTLLTSGSSSAFTVTSNQTSTGFVDGDTIAVTFHAAANASATLNVDSVGAKQIQLIPGTNLSGFEIPAGTSHRLHYSSSSTAWIPQGANLLGASSVSSNNISAGAVAYSKIQDVTAGTILGNGGSSAAPPAELTLGAGLIATTSSISAPAFPPQSAFKNLSIKVTGTTSATVAADFVTLATSGSSAFLTLPVASTINFGTNGAANALDAGSIASNTRYAIWAISKSSSTSADGLASTSFTTPALPSGYTYKARVGCCLTSTTTAAAALHGTWQYGRRAQYILGLAGTTVLPFIKQTTSASFVASDVSQLLPTTASEIILSGSNNNAAAAMAAAPSTNYATGASSTAMPPMFGLGTNNLASLVLESTNIQVVSNGGATATWLIHGWIDNI